MRADLIKAEVETKQKKSQRQFHGNQHTFGIPQISAEYQKPRQERESRTQIAELVGVSLLVYNRNLKNPLPKKF
jgi:hypothetical protein